MKNVSGDTLNKSCIVEVYHRGGFFASCVFHISLVKTDDLCVTGPPYFIWITASSVVVRMPPVNTACVISESWRSMSSTEVMETEKVSAIHVNSHAGTHFATARFIHLISRVMLDYGDNTLHAWFLHNGTFWQGHSKIIYLYSGGSFDKNIKWCWLTEEKCSPISKDVG